jgi:hypothetical protein
MIFLRKYSQTYKYHFSSKSIILFLFAYFSVFPSFSQQVDEYVIKSVFILKIPVYIEWPENSNYQVNQNDFVIGIIGEDPFKGKLQALIKKEKLKIKNKNIQVRHIANYSEINGIDLLFVANSEKYNITKILKEVQNKPILTMSDTKSYSEKGIMINMYIESGSLAFDVNMKESSISKIYISSKLLVNAKNVIK